MNATHYEWAMRHQTINLRVQGLHACLESKKHFLGTEKFSTDVTRVGGASNFLGALLRVETGGHDIK